MLDESCISPEDAIVISSEDDRLISPEVEAPYHVNDLLTCAVENVKQAPQAHWKKGDIIEYGLSAILATASGCIFWFSSGKAGDRYVAMADKSTVAMILIGYGSRIGGGVTNAAFNGESYLTISQTLKRKRSKAEKTLTQIQHERGKWIASGVVAFFAVLPTWYASLGESNELSHIIITTISALLNLPVSADGAVSLLRCIEGFDIPPRLKSSCFETAPSKRKTEAWYKAKNILADELMQKIKAIILLPSSDLKQKREGLLKNEGDNDKGLNFLKELLSTEISKEHNPSYRPVNYLLSVLFGLLTVCGAWAISGFASEAYQGAGRVCDDLGISGLAKKISGGFAAFACGATLIGFTLKGISGLWNSGKRLLRGTKSLPQVQYKKTYLTSMAVLGVFALFSGFSSDEVNYEAYEQCFSEYFGVDAEAAMASGIISNIGAAITYNMPQCLFFVERILTLCLSRSGDDELKQDNALIEQCKHFSDVLRRMPKKEFLSLFNSNLRDTFCSVLHTADNISEEEIQALINNVELTDWCSQQPTSHSNQHLN